MNTFTVGEEVDDEHQGLYWAYQQPDNKPYRFYLFIIPEEYKRHQFKGRSFELVYLDKQHRPFGFFPDSNTALEKQNSGWFADQILKGQVFLPYGEEKITINAWLIHHNHVKRNAVLLCTFLFDAFIKRKLRLIKEYLRWDFPSVNSKIIGDDRTIGSTMKPMHARLPDWLRNQPIFSTPDLYNILLSQSSGGYFVRWSHMPPFLLHALEAGICRSDPRNEPISVFAARLVYNTFYYSGTVYRQRHFREMMMKFFKFETGQQVQDVIDKIKTAENGVYLRFRLDDIALEGHRKTQQAEREIQSMYIKVAEEFVKEYKEQQKMAFLTAVFA